MNELMTALEAMIIRIVKEQAPPAPVLGTDYDHAGFRAAFVKLLSEDSRELNLYIRDTVVEDATVHDHIVEVVQGTADISTSGFRQRVKEIIDNHIDIKDAVAEALRDTTFSVTVD